MANTQLTIDARGEGWQEAANPDRISELLDDRGNLIWLDIRDPGPAELELLRREFGFHELALEDVAKRHQRPKCDSYPGYYFIVIYAAEYAADEFLPRELQLFWGENYLVTVHQGALPALDEARRHWERYEDRQAHGVGYLVYTVFDSLVDGYFPLLDWVGERMEMIEDLAFPRADERVVGEIFRLRKDLLSVRRLLGPTRDLLNEVMRRDQPLLPQALRPYFADVYDHIIRVLDGLDTHRELLASTLDLYLSSASNQLAHIMKRLTALTLIVMVPNFVAGIYGMNFERLFPPTDWEWGFPIVIGLMAIMIAWGFVHARHLRWL